MNILDQIFAQKRERLAERIQRVSRADMRARALDSPPTDGFRRALESSPHPVALIAEVKRASPVKGVLRSTFDPVQIAASYQSVGVDAMSVLTCADFFQGACGDLVAAKRVAQVPTLRKDFTVDAYDLDEARALGADAVLLIVYGLSPSQLADLRGYAEELGLDVLVEVHDERELVTALDSGATMIGVNNRDLRTFETRLETIEELAPLVPPGTHLVAESAIRSREDVERVGRAGARSVLIGSRFMGADDIPAAVAEVMGW